MPQSAKALLDYLSRELALLYKPSEARSIALWLIEFCTDLSRTSILTGSTLPPNQPDWEVLLARLRRYEPLQYVLGQTVFRELRFEVNPSVLIPRPETEELVALVLDTAPQAGGPLRLLDIGTGSGCIAVSLAAALPQSLGRIGRGAGRSPTQRRLERRGDSGRRSGYFVGKFPTKLSTGFRHSGE